jgi:hypothetical protein
VADVSRPGERDEQRRGRLEPRRQVVAELGRDARLLERERPRGAGDVTDGGRAGRGRTDDLDAVDRQRAARLGGEQIEQLGLAASRQRRLGKAAQWSVRDVRSGCRRGSQCRQPSAEGATNAYRPAGWPS